MNDKRSLPIDGSPATDPHDTALTDGEAPTIHNPPATRLAPSPAVTQPSETYRSALIMLGLLLLPFGLFWAETLGRQVFYYHDVQYYFFPYHKLVVDIIRDGHLPLWNPYAFGGIPLLGDGQTAIFYPPNWIFWLLPPAHAFGIVVLLQYSIAGMGSFLYARALGLSRLAACVAALAFMFNGYLIGRVVHLSIIAGAALIPWVFWSVERLLQRGGVAMFVIAALMVALQAVSGHPQVPIYTALAVGIYVLVVVLQRWWRQDARAIWAVPQLAGMYLVGYALAGVQLIPWIEFASFSPRAAKASYEFVTGHSIRSFDWLLFLFPYGYGGMRTTWLQSMPPTDLGTIIHTWERIAYIGLLPLALAAVGLAEVWRLPRLARQTEHAAERARRELQVERLWALVPVLILGVLIAAGPSTPFGRIVYMLPVIGKLRGYARAIIVAAFATTVLAAYGAERLRTYRTLTSRRFDWAPIAASILLLLALSGALVAANVTGADAFESSLDQPVYRVMLDYGLQLEQANAYIPLGFGIASAIGLWWFSTGLTRIKVGALLGIIALDLMSFAATFNPATRPEVFERVPPSVEFLRSDPSLYRVAIYLATDRIPPELAQSQLAVSWAIAYHIEDINGFNSLQPRRYTDFLFDPQTEDVSYGWLHNQDYFLPTNPTLSLLDVKYALVQQPENPVIPDPAWEQVYTDDTVTIYRNPTLYGRAYFVEHVAVQPDPRVILETVKQLDFQPQQTAYVESGLDAATAQRLAGGTPAAAQVERISPNELRIHTRTETDRFLVLSEMWFPGWRAEIDGRELPIYRTNYLFRGLVVPAGEHTIRMVYRPTSALLGAGMTMLTIISCGAALGITQWRRRRNEERRPDRRRSSQPNSVTSSRSSRHPQ